MNKEIFRFTSEVMLIDSEGQNQGKKRVQDAKRAAEDLGLDLVEVSKQNGTSVCRIMDYGKWKYEQRKKKKQNRHSTPGTKEVKFGMRIDKHDQSTKINHINKFLQKGHPVRMIVEMRGRERAHLRLAVDMINTLTSELNGSFKEASEVKKAKGYVSIFLNPQKDICRNGRNKKENSPKQETDSKKELNKNR